MGKYYIFKMKYKETTDAYAQIRKQENYVQRFKNGQNYLELEAIVKNKVGEFLLGNERLLESYMRAHLTLCPKYYYHFQLSCLVVGIVID
jgi:hypothetical protein